MTYYRELSFFPEGVKAKFYFLLYVPIMFSLKLFGKMAFLGRFVQLPNYNQMVDTYGDCVNFVTIYIREAHPENGEWPEPDGPQLKNPDTIDARVSAARRLLDFEIKGQLLVDSMEDGSIFQYGSLPERLVVIGPDGHVAYDGAMGPWGYSQEAVEAQIQLMLKRKS